MKTRNTIKTRMRRLLAVALTFMLIVGMLPISAFAENDAPATGTDIAIENMDGKEEDTAKEGASPSAPGELPGSDEDNEQGDNKGGEDKTAESTPTPEAASYTLTLKAEPDEQTPATPTDGEPGENTDERVAVKREMTSGGAGNRSDAVREFTYVAPEISGSGMGTVYVYVEDSQSNEGWPGYRYIKPGDKIDASKGLRIKVFPYCSDLNRIKLQIGTGSGSSFSLKDEKILFKPDPEDGYVYTVEDLSGFTNWGGDLLRVSADFEFRPEFAGVCHILEKKSTGGGSLGLYDFARGIELKRGYRGSTIEAYVVPDEGYTISGLYLLKRDDPLPTENFEITSDFTPINERQYTFTMPDHSAKVYAVFTLESAHSHRWNYRSEGNQIIASCDCGKQPRLGLSARGHLYNGEKGMAWLYLDSWKFTGDGEPLPAVSEADIVYDDTPEKAGKHTVTLTVGGATAEATYTINKAHAGIYVIDQSYPYDGELHGPGVKTYTDPDEIARYVTVSTLRNGNKLASVTIEGQGKEIGEYPLKITDYRIENAKGEDVSENYDVGCYDGTLHIDTTATKYNLWVGGIRVTSDNAADIFGNGDVGATAIYSHSTKTLILNNCYYEGKGYKYGDSGDDGFYAAIHAEDQDLTILLLGANTIKNTAASTDVGAGIYIYKGGLTIEGTGTLTATGNSKNDDGGIGICTVWGDITINGGTVTASGIDGIAADGDNRKLKVNGGTVIAIGSDRGISAADVIIADGMAVIAGDSEETAIDVDKTNFETDHRQYWVKIAPADSTPTYTVALKSEPDGACSLTGGGDYAEETEVTVTAAANEGYSFEGWYLGTNKVSGDASYTFTPTEDITLTAKFVLNPPAPVISPAEGLTKTYDKEEAILSVENATAYPSKWNPVYQWYKDGSSIEGANGSTYTVKDVSDSGAYKVAATVTEDGKSVTSTSDEINVAINAKDSSALTVRFAEPAADHICDGNAHEPEIIVKDGETIVSSDNYAVAYGNNVNVSTQSNPATATVSFRGNYTGAKTLTFEIKQLPSRMKVATIGDIGVNKEFAIEATLTDEEGAPLCGREIFIFVNNIYLSNLPKTDANGKVTVPYTPNDAVTLNIRAVYPSLSTPSDTYAASEDVINVVATQAQSVLKLKTYKNTYIDGEDVTISGKLEDGQGRPISDAAIALSVNGKAVEADPPVMTDAKGEFSHTFKADATGAFMVKAKFDGIGVAIGGSTDEVSFDVVHDLTHHAKVDATCEQDGTEEYWQCEGCGKYYSDAEGQTEISGPVTIPAGHDWSMRFYWGIPTTPIGGTVTYEKPGVMLSCSRNMFHQHIVPSDNVTFEESRTEPKCEEDGSVVYSASADYLGAHGEDSKTVTLNKLGHDWGEWTVTKEATAEEEGERIHSCMREGCGKSETQTIPKIQAFTVSFDAGDGSGEMASVQVANNEDWQLPQSTFTHPEGKAFKGWSAGGSEYKAGQKYTPTADITFTALWSEARYTGSSGIHYVEVGDSKTFTFKANEGWFYQEHDIQGLSPKALQFLSISGIDGGSNNLSDRSSTEFTVTFAPTYFPEGSQTMHKGGYTYTITHCETTIRPNIYWRNTGVGDYDYPIMDKFVVVPGRTSIDLGSMERYEIVLNPGAELQLNPVVRNIRNQVISKENGYTVDIPQLSFKSSNEDVATVSADGKITPEGGGKADIIISFIGNASYKAAEYVTLKVVVQEPVSVKGTVVWDDGDNIDGRRPEKTWLMIRRKDGETVVDKDGYTVAKEVEIAGTQGMKLSCTWENLPKYKQGTSGAELIEYEVVETSGDGMVWTPGGYEKLASGDMESGFVITNRYIPKQTDIVVTKVWEDDGNAGGKRPESVTLHLDQKPFVSTGDDDIQDVAAAQTADEAGGWKALWQGLPYNEKKSGQFTGAINYQIREDAPAGYTGAVTQTDAGLRASIVWADGVNEEDKPASITATLISETGDATSRIAALSAVNNWTCTFDGLSPNQAARYTVSLASSPLARQPELGYLQLSVIREYTLTNTLIPTIELTIDTPKCGTVVDEDKSYPFNPADGSRRPEAQSNRPVGNVLTNGWEFVKSTADLAVDWLKWGPFTNWNENPTIVFPITLTGGGSYNALGRIIPAGGATVPAAVSLVINGQELPQDRVKVDNGIIYFAASIEAAHTLEKQARKEPSCSEPGYEEHWKCTACGKLYSDENGQHEIAEPVAIEKLPHTPGEAVRENEVPASCSAEGSYDEVVYCTECKEELSRENKKIDKLPHTPGEAVRENEVPATCSAEGSYDEVVYCTECKTELSRENKKIDKLPHTPGEAVRENEVPATCSAEGSYDEVVYCTECKEELSRENKKIDKLAHTPGEAVRENEVPATCAKEGSYDEVIYCTECKAELSRESKTIDKLAHTPGEAVRENEVPSSCSAEGSYDEVIYCTECKVELSRETKTIDKLPHTPGEAVHENEVPATCESEGSYDEVIYCTECEVELSRDTKLIGRTGHDWGRWIVTKEATETDEGVEKRTCMRNASHTETRSIPKLEPTIIFYRNTAGDGGEWTKGSDDTLGFTFERSINDAATFDLFTEIKVDEETVPEKDDSGEVNYTTQSGSVIIELQPSFLETLSVGAHTLTAQFEDGSATAEFTVNPEQQENPDDSTGDNTDDNTNDSTDDNTNDSTNPNTNDTDNKTSDKTNNNTDSNTSDNTNPSTNNKTTPTKPAPTSGKTTTAVPKTGDESNVLLWCLLLAVSIGALLFDGNRRRHPNIEFLENPGLFYHK